MTTLIPYFIKVIVCSALLMGYYYLALRNKAFHQWNRFYLIATVILSLLIPCFTFTISHTPAEAQNQVIQMLQVVTVSGTYEEQLPVIAAPTFWEANGVVLLYSFVSIVLLLGLLLSLYKIYRLIKEHSVQQQGAIKLILTSVKGAPFSFFHFLFWNPSIDMNEEAGQQIFQHELVHIEEKHSLDKLFLQLVLIACWINPIFWIIRYELRMVHEFIADRKAVAHQDASALAKMILQAAYPQHFSVLTNAFFHQSIKRRLHMLTKIHNPKKNYISRILLLPLLALLTMAFTVRTELTEASTYIKAVKKMALTFTPTNLIYKNADSSWQSQDNLMDTTETKQKLRTIYTGTKKMRIVIDAGHGGHDNGAGSNEVLEKDIALAIAKEVKALNANANVEIILTRDGDRFVKLTDRVSMAATNKADLLVSVHVGAAPPKRTENGMIENPHRGFEVYIPRDTVAHFEQSKLLGSALLSQLNTIGAVPARMQLLQRNVNIWVLNKNTCPSVLIECGYLSSEKDRTFLLQKKNQQQVAIKLLEGIEGYLQASAQKTLKTLPVKENNVPDLTTASIVDTIQPIVVKSGEKYTVAQLQAIPFALLLQPDTEYTMESAYVAIDEPNGDLTEFKVFGTTMPKRLPELISKAKAGNMITIDKRLAVTKEGTQIKLPSLVYFVK